MPNSDTITNITRKAEAEAIGELARAAALAPQLVTITDPRDETLKAPLLLVQDPKGGVQVLETSGYLDDYRTRPERRKGTARALDLASFMSLTQRFADEDSALFADPSPTHPSLTAVLDYHRQTADGAPRFGEHRVVYAFPLSDEWKAWQAMNGKEMSQAQFAEFVENRILDVADPSGAGEMARALAEGTGATFASPSRLLELSRGLSVRVGQKVRNAANLATGEVEVQFVTEHQDQLGQPLRVPSAFLVAFPVFRQGDAFKLPVRLRYRLRDGDVRWFYELYRADLAFEAAFNEACAKAHQQTGLPLFFGAPET